MSEAILTSAGSCLVESLSASSLLGFFHKIDLCMVSNLGLVGNLGAQYVARNLSLAAIDSGKCQISLLRARAAISSSVHLILGSGHLKGTLVLVDLGSGK